jgi:protein involved in polysaccharide export with SLBB domain
VTLAGVRAKDVESVLRSQLGGTFTNFNLNANLDRLRSMQVYVVGQAQQPGTYTLSSLSTLVNAVFASGGPSVNGSMRNIQLKRGGRVVTTFDLYDFIGKGDKSRDVPLQPGDVIVIPPVGPRVALTGALDNAAIYELKAPSAGQTSLGDLLMLNGGVPVLATTQKALVERVVPGQIPPRQVQDLVLDAAGLQKPLLDGDVVTLLSISPAFANAVTLQGNVAAPLRYRWFPGMKIRDLIPERDALITPNYYLRKNMLVQSVDSSTEDPKIAGSNVTDRVRGIVDQINWDYAVVERLDRDRLRTQLIPFNLAGAVLRGDESQNLALEAGDVVTILSEKDLRLPVERQSRLVRLEGEVAAPGVYEALPGETLSQLIRRLGGLRPQAYVFGTEIDRVSVRKKQQENLDMLIRRLEQQQQSQMLFLVANRPADGSQAAVMEQQRESSKAQLAALRTLKSSGRIGLELDPEQTTLASLPDLPLEDGDRIMVPPVPGFVSAVGAINNENVFVFKPGRTVDDITKSAGIREEADKSLMFVLRADGSIVARSDRKSFFGDNFDSMKLMPGDTLIVPEKLDRETTRNFLTRQLKDWSQILSQFGLSLAAIKVLRDL